jgi:hypothetical protein
MCEDGRLAKRPLLAYNKYSTIFHTRNLIATARALPSAAAYGIITLDGGKLTEKRGLELYDDYDDLYMPMPHGEGYTDDIDDAEFSNQYKIGESVRRFLATSAEVIKLLGEDLVKAYALSADTCADEIVSLIEELRVARLDCMREICMNCNLVSWSLFDDLPGEWRPQGPPVDMWYCPESLEHEPTSPKAD